MNSQLINSPKSAQLDIIYFIKVGYTEILYKNKRRENVFAYMSKV